MAKEKDNALIEENDEVEVDEAALRASPTDDEASLSDAMNANPFKLFFVRNFIKLKNHLDIIPMLLTIVCLIVISFSLNSHATAVSVMIYDHYNAILLFANLLLAIILVLSYLQVRSKKTVGKKKILMSVVFYAVLAIELVIDFRYIYYFDVQMSLTNNVVSITDSDGSLAASRFYTLLHIIMLFITAGLAIIAPIVQPYAKKIHLKIK